MTTQTEATHTDDAEEPRVLLAAEELLGFSIAGRYRLEALVGEGGMGVVYRSHQPGLQRDIAIKLLKPSDVQGAKRLERFQREIAIIAGLSHPNIVRVFDSGVDDRLGLHFIAMELVDGVSLDTLIKHHTVKPELALEIVYQMCAALTEPHAHNIIHRDIKPENALVAVMSDNTLQVKILDFGIAQSHSGDGGRLTTTGVVMGTPRYMAPETVQGKTLTARTDLYAVGVILYEMFTGRTPFAGTTPVATMIDHVTKPVPRLDETIHNFEYPKISELVRSLLEKDESLRPKSAAEVRESIDAIRDAYGFGRLRFTPGDTLTALSDWLEDAPQGASESYDEIAGSFDSTLPMDAEGEVRTDSSMIPVPAVVARRHFKEMGWSNQMPDASAELAQAEENTPSPSSTPWFAIGAVVLVLVAAAAWWLRPTSEPVDLAPGHTDAVKTPDPLPSEPVVVAPTVEPAVNDPVASVDAGEDAAPAVNAAVEKKVEVERKVVAKPAEPKVEDTVKQEDEVKKGLEWINTP
ncbi:MAG: protein kinase [bacterium]